MRRGADLSYDFVNRPAYHHALATGNTEFLRLTLNISLESHVPPISLVHALQNHDELTYELVHFETLHRDSVFAYQGVEVTGSALAQHVRGELVAKLTGEAAPYNAIFTTNGIASTTATIIAASLGYPSLDAIDEDAVERITKAHLLLAMFNAFQPGVFALSGWDLTGMVTVDQELIGHLLATGDTRWIHRGAYDLMDYQPNAHHSGSGMPRARSLYGSLPQQLADPSSFASALREVLGLRERSGIATATQVDVPPTQHPAVLVMVHDDLAGPGGLTDPHRMPGATGAVDGSGAVGANAAGGKPPILQATVLNFSAEAVSSRITSEHLQPGSVAVDGRTGTRVGEVDDLRSLEVELGAHDGLFLLFSEPPTPEQAATPD